MNPLEFPEAAGWDQPRESIQLVEAGRNNSPSLPGFCRRQRFGGVTSNNAHSSGPFNF
jgi:hypothetical protein